MAGTREITILDPDETFEGALPLVAGRRFPAVELPEQVAEDGLYLWAGGDAQDVLERLRQHADVRILLERELRSRPVILAEVEPRPR